MYEAPRPAPRLGVLGVGTVVDLNATAAGSGSGSGSAGVPVASATNATTSVPASVAVRTGGLPSPVEPFPTASFSGSAVPLSTPLRVVPPVMLNDEDEFITASVALNADDEFVHVLPSSASAAPSTTKAPSSRLYRKRAVASIHAPSSPAPVSPAYGHATLLPILNVWNPTSATSKAPKPDKSTKPSPKPSTSGTKAKRAAASPASPEVTLASGAVKGKPAHRRPAQADEGALKKRTKATARAPVAVFAKEPNPRKALLRARDAERRKQAGKAE